MEFIVYYMLHKLSSNGQDFSEIAFLPSEQGRQRDTYPRACRHPIVLNQYNVIGVEPWLHGLCFLFTADNVASYLLAPDGHQNFISNSSYCAFVIDMDDLRGFACHFGSVASFTVVDNTNPRHKLELREKC